MSRLDRMPKTHQSLLSYLPFGGSGESCSYVTSFFPCISPLAGGLEAWLWLKTIHRRSRRGASHGGPPLLPANCLSAPDGLPSQALSWEFQPTIAIAPKSMGYATGQQNIGDAGPLYPKRMEAVDGEGRSACLRPNSSLNLQDGETISCLFPDQRSIRDQHRCVIDRNISESQRPRFNYHLLPGGYRRGRR